MHTLTDQQLADALLTIVAAIPTDVPVNVVAVHGLGVVLAWDWREDAQAAILEALAREQGDVVASSVDHRSVGGEQIIAAMFRPSGDLEEAAGTLRATYLIATAPDDPIGDDPDGPF